MSSRFALACGLVMLVAAPASAQEDEADWDAWEIDWRGSAAFVIAPGWSGEDDALPEAEPLTGELSFGLRADRVLSNGAEIGARVTVRAQADHPARPGGAGAFGGDGIGIPGSGVPGAQTGVSAMGAPLDEGVRASLETAYVYIDGGLGELTVGRDIGIGARFHEGPADVFDLARADSALLDPGGISLLRTRNDPSGVSLKATYASPRILGVRLGVSFSPDADEAEGLDRDPGARALGTPRPQLAGSVEAALNASRPLGRTGPRLNVGVAWSSADIETSNRPILLGDQSETLSAGLGLEWDHITLAAAWLKTDNGYVTGGEAEAWSVGASGAFGDEAQPWEWSALWGETSDDAAGLDGRSVSVGLAREVRPGIRIAAGYRSDWLDTASAGDFERRGLLVEIRFSR